MTHIGVHLGISIVGNRAVLLLVKRSVREECKINIKKRQNTERQHDGIKSNSVIYQSINTIDDARVGPGVCQTKKRKPSLHA